ncbi:MAG: hypothetical protein A3C84_02105 [Candidatus Ryanbacteria bacterium RIFCSPHIGHO2_02_FULL_48_12]|uniref:Uncharacterized protein n=1 Tax=Candidatus Ryanbacteria bacterium RIFCSPHIGHO2_01_FULL_48_27 TaxID=1802115 RepID=A0A1G2G330_9BACT|nr:MAG: hypothetical protein A2756_04535 [Candidatus Ryanbacteria bacterium RIFCSPHIGHO2_01_FULL_48_27]OGZ49246.1 MAG: hypothetical protein A3C84_02105 [Candidatus Ryanbacteria bacterium RIFCSPHIGHO2_02_FULL_48_12]
MSFTMEAIGRGTLLFFARSVSPVLKFFIRIEVAVVFLEILAGMDTSFWDGSTGISVLPVEAMLPSFGSLSWTGERWIKNIAESVSNTVMLNSSMFRIGLSISLPWCALS